MKCFCFVFPKKPTDFLILRYFISSFFLYTLYSIECLGNIIDICFFLSCCTTQVKIFLYIFYSLLLLSLMLFLFFQFYIHFFFLHACYSRLSVNILFISFPLCIVCLFDVEILVVRQSLNNIKYV